MAVVLPFPTRRVRAQRRSRAGLLTRETAIVAGGIALLITLLMSLELRLQEHDGHLPVTFAPALPGGAPPPR
jgi:hypothetical protein